MASVRQTFLAVTTLLAALILAACSPATPTATGELAEIHRRGKLVMLCFPNSDNIYIHPRMEELRKRGKPLAEIHDPSAYGGIELDLMTGFAEELGVELEVHPVTSSYQDLVQALVDGKGDLIASSLSVTEARDQVLDFSLPTTTLWISVVAPRGSPITSVEDLRGKTGVVMKGSSHLEWLQTHGPEDVHINLTDFSLENLVQLSEGTADFTLLDSAVEVGSPTDTEFPDLVVALRVQPMDNAIAVPEGSDLLRPLNDYMERMVESGRVETLRQHYLAQGWEL